MIIIESPLLILGSKPNKSHKARVIARGIAGGFNYRWAETQRSSASVGLWSRSGSHALALQVRDVTCVANVAHLGAIAPGPLRLSHVGALREWPSASASQPAGFWVWNHIRVPVGKGKAAYEKAKQFAKGWGQFQHGWTEVDPASVPVPGAGIVISAGLEVGGFGFWSALPLQVLSCEEVALPSPSLGKGKGDAAGPRNGPGKAFRYSCGTLRGHWFQGEERFSVEWEGGETGTVTFEVLSFSRPDGVLSTLAYPINRLLQLRFGMDAAKSARLLGQH